jgi:hypothetical protein
MKPELKKTRGSAEGIEGLTGLFRRWQSTEDHSAASTTQIIDKTKNPLIRLVMEIIRQDSMMHKRVRQFMIDSLEKEAVTLTPDELGEVWESVERHAALEKETIQVADQAQENCRFFVQRHLRTYLVEDEQLHGRLLGQPEDFKRKICP